MDTTTYIEDNYRYVAGRLHQHGFPDTKNAELLEQMMQGKGRILLEFHSAEYAGNVRAIAHVEKAESGTYFPNRYQLELKKPESKYALRQFFQIQNFKGHGRQYDVPWKMGVNLLRGAQVLNNWLLEDGSTVREWRTLDFSQRTNAGYGHISFDPQELDVVKKLNELPIQEKNKDDLRHSSVVRSLEMGNTQAVHLEGPENFMISLRANVRKRELDIVKGGHIISLEQFNQELSEWRNQGVYIGDNPWEQDPVRAKQPENQLPTNQKNGLPAAGQVEPENKEQSQRPSAIQKTGQVQGVVKSKEVTSGLNSSQQKEHRLAPSGSNKVKKILTGNPITPAPSNRQGNARKQGI